MKFVSTFFLLVALLARASADEGVTSDPTSCQTVDMRGNVVDMADGDTFTTEAFCRHVYSASDGYEPSVIVKVNVLCTNGVPEDVSEDVLTCPEDEPVCYDLDKYDHEEWEPSCIIDTSKSTTSAGSDNNVQLAFAIGIPAIIVMISYFA